MKRRRRALRTFDCNMPSGEASFHSKSTFFQSDNSLRLTASYVIVERVAVEYGETIIRYKQISHDGECAVPGPVLIVRVE